MTSWQQKNYKMAAEQGDIVAQCNLATMIMMKRTQGTDEEAAKYFFFASESGYGRAQLMMGKFCEEGRGGVKKSNENAASYYEAAAEQGVPGAKEAQENFLERLKADQATTE